MNLFKNFIVDLKKFKLLGSVLYIEGIGIVLG